MAVHEMKSWPWFFEAMVAGEKKHDFRSGIDRKFYVGDTLRLREFDPRDGVYSGRVAEFVVTYITSQETPCALSSAVLLPGYVVLSVEKQEKSE